MKARVTVCIAGERSYLPGDVVEGSVALDLVQAGYATPIRGERSDSPASAIEVATVTRKRPN